MLNRRDLLKKSMAVVGASVLSKVPADDRVEQSAEPEQAVEVQEITHYPRFDGETISLEAGSINYFPKPVSGYQLTELIKLRELHLVSHQTVMEYLGYESVNL